MPVQQLESTERGIIFNQLPRFLGGGLKTSIVSGGELRILLPYERLIRINTGTQDVFIGEGSGADELSKSVFTRALDGNEVALKMTVRFQIKDTPETLIKLVQDFAPENEAIKDRVIAITRAEVRSKMNDLRTSGFLDENLRYEAVDSALQGIQKRLDPYGITVTTLTLDKFEFARLNADGTVDRVYQDRLNEVQRIREETEREKLRIETVRAEGQQKFNIAQAEVNRTVAEAKGFMDQAKARGDGYQLAKQSEAQGISAKGENEVKALIEKINAFSGPGGAALLKLEIAKALSKSGAKFITMGDSKNGMSVERTDTNQLLGQLGLIEGMKDSNSKEKDK